MISNPATGLIPGPRLAAPNISLRVDGAAIGTTVVFNIKHGAVLYGSGSNIMSSDLTVDSSTESTVSFSNPLLLQNEWLWLSITSVSAPSGTSTQFVTTLATTV